MSRINDALKRARDLHSSHPAPPPLPAAEPSPRPPAVPPASNTAVWGWALAAGLSLAVAGLIAGRVVFNREPPPVAIVQAPPAAPPVAPPPLSSVSTPTGETTDSPPAIESNVASATPAEISPPAGVSEVLPKVQGIIFNAPHPLAIVSGQTVGVGDRVGEFQVKAILPHAVTFQRPDGSLKQLGIGE